LRVAASTVDFPNSPGRTADDGATVAAAAAGSRRAFEQLYRRHSGRVFGLCMRLTGHRETAEDCVQETFVSAWRALARFESRSTFSTWLHRIAVNTVLGRHRTQARLRESEDEPGEVMAAERGGADETPPIDLESAIAALPAGARHVLVLVGLYGYSHEEAAEALGIAVGTSKAQLHRARQALAARLELSLENP
jgi:RNA polymerase sigma-70 factor (ECF subfamily)